MLPYWQGGVGEVISHEANVIQCTRSIASFCSLFSMYSLDLTNNQVLSFVCCMLIVFSIGGSRGGGGGGGGHPRPSPCPHPPLPLVLKSWNHPCLVYKYTHGIISADFNFFDILED